MHGIYLSITVNKVSFNILKNTFNAFISIFVFYISVASTSPTEETCAMTATCQCRNAEDGLSAVLNEAHQCRHLYYRLAHSRQCTSSPGQNATGQNATNSGLCFYFLQMLFRFVALPFNMSQPLVISAYHKLCFAHTTLITGTPLPEH